jgi:hypothetical protein
MFLNLKIGNTYLYGWNRMCRRGEICTLLAIAPKWDSVLIQFQRDGYQAVTSAKALKLIPQNYIAEPRLF